MKQIILIGLVFLLVACSPEIEQTPEVIPTQASVSQAELTPDVTVDVDTVAVSLAELSILEDTFTTSTTYSNATFGEAIFDAKCNACLILPDAVISSDSDISDVYAKAIYYADNIISPEGYLFTSMQENEWNTLTENEVYNVIAYFKSVYNADMQNIDVALLATPEPEATEEAIVETQEDTTTSDDTTETEDTASESNNPFVVGVANADPVVGEQLFTSNFVTPCNTCHFVDSEAMLVGPGLLNIGDHAEIRIEGVTAEEYLYTSIVHPNDFIVDGFAAAMPEMYETGLSQDEVYNLVAYLMTLGAEDDTTDDTTTETDDVVEDPSDNATEEDTTTEEDTASDIETENPFVVGVANADPVVGEQLFTSNFVTPCNTCHFVDSEAMLVGPGLLNIGDHAETRIEGVTAEEYLYTSIVHPNDFIVDGFAAAMPEMYETGLSQDEVYNLVAYLMTLGAEDDTTDDATTETDDVVEDPSDNATEEDTTSEDTTTESDNPIVVAVANADPINGEQLYITNFISPCNACHFSDTEAMLVGPGLLNIRDRAGTRVEGLTAEEYLYESIIHPNDFIVDGFAAAMPTTYETGLTEDEVYDLIAYLMSLGE